MSDPENRKEFVLVLRPLPQGSTWRTSPTQRLRLVLKIMLRGFGLRCVSVKERQEQ